MILKQHSFSANVCLSFENDNINQYVHSNSSKYTFVCVNFMMQMNIIGKTLPLYTKLWDFTAYHKKSHFTSGMDITMLILCYQTAQTFIFFFLKDKTRKLLFCTRKLSLTHTTYQRQNNTYKLYHSFIVRRLVNTLSMMKFGTLKQLITKTILIWVE